jgi:hypothetical protein
MGLAFAQATPPALVNYQGVLRNASDDPLDGTYNMRFLFFSDETAGDEILIDEHLLGNGVTVTGGLFNVKLGGGSLADGSGPGLYRSLREVFRDYGEVWLEVWISPGGSAWETLTPRIQVLSAGFALNADQAGHAGDADHALDADQLGGQSADYFINTSSSPQTKTGWLSLDASAASSFGIEAYGQTGGGYFEDSDGSGYASVGSNHLGIDAHGSTGGGYFMDDDGSSWAYVSYGNLGIHAQGNTAGGRFDDGDGSSWAYAGYDGFEGDYGIYAKGEDAGGYFSDRTDSGNARLGHGDVGITAYGDDAAGYFENSWVTSSWAELAGFSHGVDGHAGEAGGYFTSTHPGGTSIAYTGYAVGQQFYAFRGLGTDGGGFLEDADSGTYGFVSKDTASTSGNGEKNFVQNHPEQSDRVVVYTSLEGDETGTYTRGTARLVDGRARVRLGETFKWVTNPDIGLTAQVTPRGDPIPLSVESMTTEELVVRGPGGSNAAFDYVVFGLRIGFEESSVVREKTIESFIPSMARHRELYARHSDLRLFNALERFKAMAADVWGPAPVDLSRTNALMEKIQEYAPQVHGPVWSLLGHELPEEDVPSVSTPASSTDITDGVSTTSAPDRRREHHEGSGRQPVPMDDQGHDYARSIRPSAMDIASLVRTSEPVEPGDVLVIDAERPGLMKRSDTAADGRVLGIVAEDPGVAIGADWPQVPDHAPLGFDDTSWNETSELGTDRADVPVALSGMTLCKVDAGFGSIRAGDLLTTSPTPGHAMRTVDPSPGTILGKALEPLDTGTGLIKVLVMLR